MFPRKKHNRGHIRVDEGRLPIGALGRLRHRVQQFAEGCSRLAWTLPAGSTCGPLTVLEEARSVQSRHRIDRGDAGRASLAKDRPWRRRSNGNITELSAAGNGALAIACAGYR